jgi:hypothetical protein
LAREWESLLQNGTYGSRAELARSLGVSRARVTQVLNLLILPTAVCDAIAERGDPVPRGSISERRLRQLLKAPPDEVEQALERGGAAEIARLALGSQQEA